MAARYCITAEVDYRTETSAEGAAKVRAVSAYRKEHGLPDFYAREDEAQKALKTAYAACPVPLRIAERCTAAF